MRFQQLIWSVLSGANLAWSNIIHSGISGNEISAVWSHTASSSSSPPVPGWWWTRTKGAGPVQLHKSPGAEDAAKQIALNRNRKWNILGLSDYWLPKSRPADCTLLPIYTNQIAWARYINHHLDVPPALTNIHHGWSATLGLRNPPTPRNTSLEVEE